MLTVSDTRTDATDSSGRAIVELLEGAGHTVVGRAIVPDEPDRIRHWTNQALREPACQAVIVTGGTGIARRDTTVEALSGLFEKEIVGFGELFRMLSYREVMAAAMVSRASAGVVNGRVVFLLPGSEAATRLAMTALILPELDHIIRELER